LAFRNEKPITEHMGCCHDITIGTYIETRTDFIASSDHNESTGEVFVSLLKIAGVTVRSK